MRLYYFLSHWLPEHPVLAGFFVALATALVIAQLPLVGYLLPVKKVPLTYNLRNLQNRWKTTIVTALAFTMVTALLTVMLAFVRGMDRMTEGSGNPGNVLVLSDGATDEVFSSLPPFSVQLLPRDVQQQVLFTPDGKNYLAAQEVYVLATYLVPNNPRKRRFLQMRGLDKPEVAALLHEIELAEGSWPSPSGVREATVFVDGQPKTITAKEVVLGAGIARLLGGDFAVGKTLHVGDVLEIGRRQCYVCGVMSPNSSTFGSEVWTTDLWLQKDYGREGSYNSYVVRTPSLAKAKLAAAALKNFRSERNLVAFPEREYYAKLSETNKQFGAAIYFIAIVMAIGGMLGIMNTMFAAVSQRMKDIGVLRLMGFRRWQILMSFQAESLLIALLGGALGCLVGLLFDGFTANSILSAGAGGGGKSVVLKLTVDTGVLLTGMIFAVLMGAIGGFLPSINAMRLRPLESLK